MVPARRLWLVLGVASALALTTFFAQRPARACKVQMPRLVAPEVVEYSASVGPEADGTSYGLITIKMRAPAGTGDEVRYVAEKTWSRMRGPNWISGQVSSAERDGLLVWTASVQFPDGAEPLGYALRLRAIDEQGRLGRPSEPVVVFHPGLGHQPPPSRSDQLLFLILGTGFLCLWCWYRREADLGYKIRLAGAAALASVLFLAVTPAMPWYVVENPGAGLPQVECLLGDEAECATYAAASDSEALLDRETMVRRTFELQRWESASAAVRLGQVFSLVMLIPALIWLIVAPRNRAAQSAFAVGASVSAFTLVSVLFFAYSLPPWLEARLYWTSDLALMTSANVVIAAVLVVKHAFAMLEPTRIPPAIARARSASGS